MRVGLVRRRFQLHGGAERFTARFLHALRERGDEVTLITEEWEAVPPDVRVVRVPVARAGGAVRALSFAFLAAHRGRQLSLDLIHSLDRVVHQDLYRAGDGVHREWLARRRASFPRLATLTDRLEPFHYVVLALERRIFQRNGARLVVANSRQVAREIVQHYDPVSAPIEVVRNGVDLAHFHPAARTRLGPAMRRELGLEPEDRVLVFVGSGFTRKGLGSVLHALGRLAARTRCWLLVAGKGRVEPYRAMARRLGIAGTVRFLGVVSDPLPLYAAGDMFVLPSFYDPASNACLEAMAVGLPVVTTRANGASELVEHGRDGWILEDPQDAVGLSERLAALNQRELLREMGQRARDRVEAYSWERHVREIRALYARLRPTA